MQELCVCYVLRSVLMSVYVMFCQRMISLMFSIGICCGSVSLKERNWVKGN